VVKSAVKMELEQSPGAVLSMLRLLWNNVLPRANPLRASSTSSTWASARRTNQAMIVLRCDRGAQIMRNWI